MLLVIINNCQKGNKKARLNQKLWDSLKYFFPFPWNKAGESNKVNESFHRLFTFWRESKNVWTVMHLCSFPLTIFTCILIYITFQSLYSPVQIIVDGKSWSWSILVIIICWNVFASTFSFEKSFTQNVYKIKLCTIFFLLLQRFIKNHVKRLISCLWFCQFKKAKSCFSFIEKFKLWT